MHDGDWAAWWDHATFGERLLILTLEHLDTTVAGEEWANLPGPHTAHLTALGGPPQAMAEPHPYETLVTSWARLTVAMYTTWVAALFVPVNLSLQAARWSLACYASWAGGEGTELI